MAGLTRPGGHKIAAPLIAYEKTRITFQDGLQRSPIDSVAIYKRLMRYLQWTIFATSYRHQRQSAQFLERTVIGPAVTLVALNYSWPVPIKFQKDCPHGEKYFSSHSA